MISDDSKAMPRLSFRLYWDSTKKGRKRKPFEFWLWPLHCVPSLGCALVSCPPPVGSRIPAVIGSSQKPGTVTSFAAARSCLSGLPPPPVEAAPFQSSGAGGAVCDCVSVFLPVLRLVDGAVQSHHGGSTAGAAGLVPPTRTFFVMLSTLS